MHSSHAQLDTHPLDQPATVILLNGVGSVGKGSIARALQKITRTPFLHVEMDAFLAMLPPAYHDHPDGMAFTYGTMEGKPSVGIETGPVVERALSGMRRSVAALASSGNNLIVDEVLFGNVTTAYGNTIEDYQALLEPYHFFKVGVFAPLDVIETRERARGDRTIGLARWQYDRVHRNMTYDLEVDAGAASPEECAKIIRKQFEL